MPTIYTIGHSSHAIDRFLALLDQPQISLSEEFHGRHYKLVAGVIVPPKP